MPKCAIKKCKSSSVTVQKKDGVSYFHFPQNEERKEQWRLIVARDRNDDYYKPNASSVICSQHFNKDDIYLTKKGFNRLKNTAIPNIEQEASPPSVNNMELPSISGNIISNSNIDSTQDETCNVNSLQLHDPIQSENSYFRKQTIPVVKPSSTSWTFESVLDTPREAELRKNLILCKRKLSDKIKKVKNLQRVNKRLLKKVATLKTTIVALRKQKHLDESILADLSHYVVLKDT